MSLVKAMGSEYYPQLVGEYPERCHLGHPCLRIEGRVLKVAGQILDGEMAPEDGQREIAGDADDVEKWCKAGQTAAGCSAMRLCGFHPPRHAELFKGVGE